MSQRSASAALLAARAAVVASIADVPARGAVVVACSGGPDSLALVGAAAWVTSRRDIGLHCVVVDHGLQSGSAQVAEHAADQCLLLGAGSAEVVPVTVGTSGGPEAAARDARYSALSDAADRHGSSVVLLGHTRDDQAETVLLRLARGSGARSLSAMRPNSGRWRRPFLGLSRASVHEAASELLDAIGELPWRDPHNEDPAYARVRVRGLIDELVNTLGAGVVIGLSRSADLLRDDADLLDEMAAGAARVLRKEPTGFSAAAADLLDLPRAIRTRVIRLAALRAGSPPAELGFDQVVRIEALVTDWHGQGEISLPGRVTARRSYDRLWLLPPS